MSEHRSGFGGEVIREATPPPWHVHIVRLPDYDRIEVRDEHNKVICTVPYDGGGAEGSDGWFNAQLICAAVNPHSEQ
jgi:hypothetical protein